MNKKSIVLQSGKSKASSSTDYVDALIRKYNTGQAKEHAHRTALEAYFENITGLNVVNDPKRSEYGAPDFVFLKGKIPVSYAEAKDIGVSLNQVEKDEQLERYYGYSNLILTDYLEFRFFRNGLKYGEPIKIAELKNDNIVPIESNYTLAEDTISQFIQDAKEPIKSGILLTKVMAGKARRIRDNIRSFMKSPDDPKNANLKAIYSVVKHQLLADLDYDKFADMYAQTVVYGLFVARYYDDTPDTFTRGEARDMVPASNPFLLELFNHIAGSSFDKRLEFIVNELCEEFVHADIQAIIHDYYKVEKDSSRDPIIHFYEDFLNEYDPVERKSMGVFYTPLPVVGFIVRSIDEILKKDFGLSGLADSSKITIDKVFQGKKSKHQVHKVQILDPATGTGTFLNQVIAQIKSGFKGQEGRWPSYVKNDLLPRLHGFEIMMAPYTIAHLKLATALKESGADISGERLGVYLTNSLEKADKYDDSLFAGLGLDKAITEESRLAGEIKNNLPIMVVLGNPPYNVSSQNKGEWIGELLRDYKKDLEERNIQPLSDDYIKFIRFAEYLIEKNGEGVIGMITNNSYIDGITHRQMRKKLLETFDDIYILDLHGNSKKKEKTPDGGKDENVFNIQQGVAIVLLVRTSNRKKGLGKVWHSDLFGKREHKFDVLNKADIINLKWNKISYHEPYYFFVPKDFSQEESYTKGFKLDDLFTVNSCGIKTHNDDELVSFDNFQNDENQYYLYRPFDIRFINYDLKKVLRNRFNLMKNMLQPNLSLLVSRQQSAFDFQHVFITNILSDICAVSSQTKESSYAMPLYIYSADGSKMVNFKEEIYNEIAANLKAKAEPENVLDYIYAVLHSPSYREKYKAFLKIEFPRVPYPKTENQFFALAKLGEELRLLHLLESLKVSKFITTYTESGDNTIDRIFPLFKETISLTGHPTKPGIYINEKQYFGPKNISIEDLKQVWNFYIGGYQPAQKWLRDRKGRQLNNEDIEHYQKMVVAMYETIRIMKQIDQVAKF